MAVGATNEEVRRHNLRVVVQALHLSGPLSRAELTARTGLNRSTVAALVADLAGRGLVREGSPRQLGTPGRPSPVVHLAPDRVVVLAVEIRVDTVTAATVGLGGVVHARRRLDRTRDRLSPGDTIADIVRLAGEVLAGRRDRLVGVGVAVPGIVRRTDGFVHAAPNLRWHDVAFGASLGAALGLGVPVLLANEADLGGRAEHLRGAGVGSAHQLYISGEVGVGAGIVVDGRPLAGAAGYAGEAGHIPVNPQGVACRCGAVGCWETEVGEEALLRHAGLPVEAGGDPVGRVLEAAAAGDARAGEALETVGRWLGVGLAALVNVLNPERIVLGGSLGRIHPHVAATTAAELARRCLAAPLSVADIVPASLGEESALVGAAELALGAVLTDPQLVAVLGPGDQGGPVDRSAS